jgi:hypothetical protein
MERASHRIASHRVASQGIASHCVASHRIASHRIAGHGATRPRQGSGRPVSIRPKAGLAVIHFPSTTPETGGITDYNAYHEGASARDTKYIAQQFIWSHPVVWADVIDRSSLEPRTCLTGSCL